MAGRSIFCRRVLELVVLNYSTRLRLLKWGILALMKALPVLSKSHTEKTGKPRNSNVHFGAPSGSLSSRQCERKNTRELFAHRCELHSEAGRNNTINIID